MSQAEKEEESMEVGVRFPIGVVIHLASECIFARVNQCHVRGIGYHYSDTRVWGSMPDIVSGVVTLLTRSSTCESNRSPLLVRVTSPIRHGSDVSRTQSQRCLVSAMISLS